MRAFSFLCYSNNEELHRMINRFRAAHVVKTGFLGHQMYSKGLHFTNNRNYITGFYQNQADGTTARGGTPLKTCFIGKLEAMDDGSTCFKGWILPHPRDMIVLLILFALALATCDIYGLPIILLAVGFFVYGFLRLTEETYYFLKRIFE